MPGAVLLAHRVVRSAARLWRFAQGAMFVEISVLCKIVSWYWTIEWVGALLAFPPARLRAEPEGQSSALRLYYRREWTGWAGLAPLSAPR